MALSLESLVQSTLQDSSLRLYFNAEWGSLQENYREKIHAQLANLNAASFRYHSISHTYNLGGFALSKNPLGLDLEVSDRVQPHIAQRVCATPEEYDRAPNSSALWSAKEAAFKALRSFNQPQTISQIEIVDWHKTTSQLEIFNIKNPSQFEAPSGKGCVFQDNLLTYALYIFFY